MKKIIFIILGLSLSFTILSNELYLFTGNKLPSLESSIYPFEIKNYQYSQFSFEDSLKSNRLFNSGDIDTDSDRIPDHLDNCPFIWNPDQKDFNNNGVGDLCDPSTKIISFFENTPVGYGYSTEFLFDERLEILQLIDDSNTFLLKNDSIFLMKDLNFLDKDFYQAKITIDTPNKDTLDVLIFIDFVFKDYQSKEGKVVLQEISVGKYASYGLDQYEMFDSPYLFSSYYEEFTDISSLLGPISFDRSFIVEDINNDEKKDLVLGEYRVNHKGRNINIHQISVPVYLINNDNSFTVRRNNFFNKTIFHTPQSLFEADIDNDGKNEIINLGEHYHAAIPEHHPSYLYNRSYLRSMGLRLGIEYDEGDFKLHRYYKWQSNDEIHDQVSKYSYKDSIDNGFLSHYAAALGDINNDNFIDYVVTSQVNGSSKYSYVLDVLLNDGEGGFFVNRKQLSDYYGSEGEALLVDINDDGFKDLIIGGGERNSSRESTIAVFYNDKNNQFDLNYEVFDRMHEALGLRNIYEADLNNDGKKEIITYYSTGYGSNGGGMTLDEIPNIIKIYEVDNGKIFDVSQLYFFENQNIMNFYTQTGHLKYIDLDGDGYKDMVPRFFLEDTSEKAWDYPGNAYRGDWNGSKGFQYFRFKPEINKFELIDLGPILTSYSDGIISKNHLYNSFDYENFDDDPYLEWLTTTRGEGFHGVNLLIIKPIYILPLLEKLVIKPELENDIVNISWNNDSKAKQYNLLLFENENIILDTLLSETNFTINDYKNYPLKFKSKVKAINLVHEGQWSETIEIIDFLPPVLDIKSAVTLDLNSDGNAILTFQDIDLATFDNHILDELSVSKSTFSCTDLGENTIIFKAKDASGNESTAEVKVIVVDEIKPIVKSKSSYNIQLDAEGKAVLKWENIDEGSTDNCGIIERTISKNEFTRADSGENTITYTIKDASGNVASAEIKVRVDIILSAPNLNPEIQADIRLYPNPTKNSLSLEFEKTINTDEFVLEIVDATGRSMGVIKAAEYSGKNMRIDTSGLSNGIHFLRISSKGSLKVLKFIIER
jgi:hypothetical protein